METLILYATAYSIDRKAAECQASFSRHARDGQRFLDLLTPGAATVPDGGATPWRHPARLHGQEGEQWAAVFTPEGAVAVFYSSESERNPFPEGSPWRVLKKGSDPFSGCSIFAVQGIYVLPVNRGSDPFFSSPFGACPMRYTRPRNVPFRG